MSTKESNNIPLKTMLCCIGRLENRYIREFVEFYKKTGITTICLCDNNRDGEDNFHDVIGDYIDIGFVIIKDYRNISTPVQLKAYNECYLEYKNQYDWFLFFDIDEFLFLKKDINISSYLSRSIFDEFDMIHVNWYLFGDGGKIYYENRPILERITVPIHIDHKTSYNFPDNYHTKSIVRGGLKYMEFYSNPHTPIINGKCCNGSGLECNGNSPFCAYDYNFVELRHFTTKTAEEYAEKIRRGFCDGNKSTKKELINMFFKRNMFTEEKMCILNEV